METPTKSGEKRKRGRPTKYKPSLGLRICELIAEGKSSLTISKMRGMPSVRTIFQWLSDIPEFSQWYARAKEVLAEVYAEQIVELADKPRLGKRVKESAKNGTETVKGDMVERARLQVDARKWVAAKLLPKKYGDKPAQDGGEGQLDAFMEALKNSPSGNS